MTEVASEGVCGTQHPYAEVDPKNYGTPCDYPAGHPPVVDEEGGEWDHGYRFPSGPGGEPALLWNGYLGEPDERGEPEPRQVEVMTHDEIVARLHARHREHLGWTEDELPVAECAWCAMYAEWIAPLLAEARASDR